MGTRKHFTSEAKAGRTRQESGAVHDDGPAAFTVHIQGLLMKFTDIAMCGVATRPCNDIGEQAIDIIVLG